MKCQPGPWIALFVALFTGCSGKVRTTKYTALGGGAILVETDIFSSGFIESSVTWEFELIWPDGRRERLPTAAAFPLLTNAHALGKGRKRKIYTTEHGVWIVGHDGLVMREGGPEDGQNPWVSWSVTPSDALFDYMDGKARSAGYEGIRKSTYTISKRLSEYVVSGTETETLTRLTYTGASHGGIPYSIAPTGHHGYQLPYKIESIDIRRGLIRCVAEPEVPGMPRYLVFSSDRGNRQRWRFDRDRSAACNGTN